uniref:Zf-3CxxC domain-containing protein n=1 Tax=Macrostomum lignano TaxID=282301 RepID=A0A1I8FIZ8_9PLAT
PQWRHRRPHPAGVPDEGAEVSDIVRGGQLVHPLGRGRVFVPRLVEVRHGRAALPVLGAAVPVELVLLMEPPVDMANRYHAGCGKGWTGCKTCKTSLCNIPDSQRALAEPSSGVDFAALSQGQPAAVGRVIGPAGSKAARRRTLANATAASDSKDEKKKGAKAKAANQFDYDYDGCGDFRPTAAAVAAMALLCLWLRLPGAQPQTIIIAIECFTNGISAYLFDHFGKGGLIKCKSSTECFESWANSDSSSDSSIKYSSGCTACVKWSFDSECKTCNTPLCNFQLAKKITQNNLLCYFADDEANIGKKRGLVLQRCWNLLPFGVQEQNRYHAGCGKGWTGCKTCKTSLCNIPDSQRALAEPSSGVDFAALSQGQPAAVGRARRRTLANATAASDSKDEKKKGAKAKAANQFDYDYDGCGDFRPTAAAVAAMALLCLWLRLPASTATDNNNS